MLMKRGPDWGYFPEPAKSLFILDTPVQEEATKREFDVEGLYLNFISGSRYLGAYIGPRDHWKSLSSSLMMLSRAEQHSLMPVMGSTR